MRARRFRRGRCPSPAGARGARVGRAGDSGAESGVSGLPRGEGRPGLPAPRPRRGLGVWPPRGACGAAQHVARMGLALGWGWSFGGDPGGAGSRAAWLLGLKATVAILTSSESRQVSGSMSSLLSEPERGCVASAPRQEDGDLGIQMKAGVLLLYPLNCPWPPFPGRVLIYSTRRVKTSAHPGSGWMEA